MDATWGVVIVSVVGVLGTVAAAWITAYYSKKQTDAERAHATGKAQRAELMAHAMAFFAQIVVLDEVLRSRMDSDEEWSRLDKARSDLSLLESSLALVAPSDVAVSARQIVTAYVVEGPAVANVIQPLRDDLINKLRAAVVEGPWV